MQLKHKNNKIKFSPHKPAQTAELDIDKDESVDEFKKVVPANKNES